MRIKVTDKREFGSSIINPEDNRELARKLDPILKQYKNTTKTLKCRGACHYEAEKFVKWLEKNYSMLYNELEPTRVQGYFMIDYPEKLPLSAGDFSEQELDTFLNIYGDQIPDSFEYLDEGSKEAREMSILLWEFAKEYVKNPLEFFYIEHEWVLIDNLMVDTSWEQFRHAIKNNKNLRERYE